MTDASQISFGLAFLAGVVSFLSPCVLPIVPGMVTFVSGRTLDELTTGDRRPARAHAAAHTAFFVLGFGLVFVALGATATALGSALRNALPLLQQIGGAVIVALGLNMAGVLRLPSLMRERRGHFSAKPAGFAGSALVGAAFGAGWTPCVGPVLASILLYAGMETTMARGMMLLAIYALGLGIPFFVAAVGLNWYLPGMRRASRWLLPLKIAAGTVLVLVGVLLLTGQFNALSGFLAGFGQLISLEL